MSTVQRDLSNDVPFRCAIGALYVCAAVAALFANVVPVAGAVVVMEEGFDAGMIVVMVFCAVVFVAGNAVVFANLRTARGLRRREAWAWPVALVMGSLALGFGLWPCTIVIAVGLLRSGVKDAYDQAARPEPRRF